MERTFRLTQFFCYGLALTYLIRCSLRNLRLDACGLSGISEGCFFGSLLLSLVGQLFDGCVGFRDDSATEWSSVSRSFLSALCGKLPGQTFGLLVEFNVSNL